VRLLVEMTALNVKCGTRNAERETRNVVIPNERSEEESPDRAESVAGGRGSLLAVRLLVEMTALNAKCGTRNAKWCHSERAKRGGIP
jgi:hypothetical protein